MNIVAFSGSLRKKSYNTALLRAAQGLLPPSMSIEIAAIHDLPLFNQDLEERDFPARVRELRESIKASDGVLIATPEFNRTPPGPLKNFLDWSARPEREPLPWDGKPVGIFGASTGARGASFAQYDIRRIMGYFNAKVMGQPELYVGLAEKKFDLSLREGDSPKLTDEKTIDSLRKFLEAFKTFVEE